MARRMTSTVQTAALPAIRSTSISDTDESDAIEIGIRPSMSMAICRPGRAGSLR
jgi:hypothetical protein